MSLGDGATLVPNAWQHQINNGHIQKLPRFGVAVLVLIPPATMTSVLTIFAWLDPSPFFQAGVICISIGWQLASVSLRGAPGHVCSARIHVIGESCKKTK